MTKACPACVCDWFVLAWYADRPRRNECYRETIKTVVRYWEPFDELWLILLKVSSG